MKAVAYSNPFVPPEWITAHGLRPAWMGLQQGSGHLRMGAHRGVCPYASAVIDAVLGETKASAVVLTTTCDQMRYAAALLNQKSRIPIFLLNVPSTWQTPSARQIYSDELRRLGRFLVGLGGEPGEAALGRVMLEYDAARAQLRAARARLSAQEFAEALSRLRSGDTTGITHDGEAAAEKGIPVALLGGPLPPRDLAFLEQVERAGGRIVLEASESGERTLPPGFDRDRVRHAPLEALVDAYFGGIPDVFRRPNGALYEWLGRELVARQVRGILLRRYLWCDLWHAEVHRLKQWSPVPVLDLDVADDDGDGRARAIGRLEAFLEIL